MSLIRCCKQNVCNASYTVKDRHIAVPIETLRPAHRMQQSHVNSVGQSTGQNSGRNPTNTEKDETKDQTGENNPAKNTSIEKYSMNEDIIASVVENSYVQMIQTLIGDDLVMVTFDSIVLGLTVFKNSLDKYEGSLSRLSTGKEMKPIDLKKMDSLRLALLQEKQQVTALNDSGMSESSPMQIGGFLGGDDDTEEKLVKALLGYMRGPTSAFADAPLIYKALKEIQKFETRAVRVFLRVALGLLTPVAGYFSMGRQALLEHIQFSYYNNPQRGYFTIQEAMNRYKKAHPFLDTESFERATESYMVTHRDDFMPSLSVWIAKLANATFRNIESLKQAVENNTTEEERFILKCVALGGVAIFAIHTRRKEVEAQKVKAEARENLKVKQLEEFNKRYKKLSVDFPEYENKNKAIEDMAKRVKSKLDGNDADVEYKSWNEFYSKTVGEMEQILKELEEKKEKEQLLIKLVEEYEKTTVDEEIFNMFKKLNKKRIDVRTIRFFTKRINAWRAKRNTLRKKTASSEKMKQFISEYNKLKVDLQCAVNDTAMLDSCNTKSMVDRVIDNFITRMKLDELSLS